MKPITVIGLVVVMLGVSAIPSLSNPRHRLQAGISPVQHPGMLSGPDGNDIHPLGNVWMMDAHGQKVMLNHSGLASDVHVSPNSRYVGWTDGQIIGYHDRGVSVRPETGYVLRQVRFPAAVVIYRPGKSDLRLVPRETYFVIWRFEHGGSEVGIGCQASHGLYYLDLYDTATGKHLGSCLDFDDHLPAWTRGLRNYGHKD